MSVFFFYFKVKANINGKINIAKRGSKWPKWLVTANKRDCLHTVGPDILPQNVFWKPKIYSDCFRLYVVTPRKCISLELSTIYIFNNTLVKANKDLGNGAPEVFFWPQHKIQQVKYSSELQQI